MHNYSFDCVPEQRRLTKEEEAEVITMLFFKGNKEKKILDHIEEHFGKTLYGQDPSSLIFHLE